MSFTSMASLLLKGGHLHNFPAFHQTVHKCPSRGAASQANLLLQPKCDRYSSKFSAFHQSRFAEFVLLVSRWESPVNLISGAFGSDSLQFSFPSPLLLECQVSLIGKIIQIHVQIVLFAHLSVVCFFQNTSGTTTNSWTAVNRWRYGGFASPFATRSSRWWYTWWCNWWYKILKMVTKICRAKQVDSMFDASESWSNLWTETGVVPNKTPQVVMIMTFLLQYNSKALFDILWLEMSS